jgi:EpsI family protein
VRRIAPLFGVLTCLLLPLLSFGLARARARATHEFDTARIPARLGEFSVDRDDTLPDDVRAMLSPAAYLFRLYARADGAPVWAYVAFYDGVGASGAHDPQICYPAQGWDVVGLDDRALELPTGDQLHAHFLAATQGASEELVLYWFQPPERWPAAPRVEPWLRAVDGLAGRSRYAFVRLSTRVTPSAPDSVPAAEEELGALARELAAPVRAAVRGADS